MAKKEPEPEAVEEEQAEAVEEQPEAEEVDGTVYHPAGTGHILQDGQWVRPEVEEEVE